jgi:hypothetical protein
MSDFKYFGEYDINVIFTCWNGHKENNYCPILWKGTITKKAYLNLITDKVCIRYVHPVIFCPLCELPNKITWIEV